MNAAGRAHVLEAGDTLAAAHASRRGRRAAVAGLWITVGLGVLGAVLVHDFRTSSTAPVPLPAPSPLRALSDLRPVSVTTTTPDWTKVRTVVTVDRLRTDRTLWREMHFEDWDGVPRETREPALRAMVRAYGDVFAGPSSWPRMTSEAWDDVPQPIRAIAYLRMIWYWSSVENVGAEFGLPPAQLAQTIGAIVMAESWFEHRAVNQNAWGNRDLGLAQCSDHCRQTLIEMAARGEIAFTPEDADYFNPWTATRIATVWFERELLRAGGDVDLATRAYHRGIDRAFDEQGTAYAARVARLREQYIRSRGHSASWQWLAREIGSR